MRPFHNVLIAIVLLFALKASAAPYTFIHTNEPYQELVNPDFVIPDNSQYWNGGQILLKQNMTIKAYGTTFDLNDGIYMVMEQGYFYMIGANRSLTFYNFKADMQPRKGPTLSEFSYKLEGGAGSKVLKLQFKNMGFEAGTEAEYMNYQVWLHERGPIEVRFGSSNLSTEAYNGYGGPAIGLLFMDEHFNSIYDQMYLTGDAPDPGTTTGEITGIIGTPAEGTIFRFVPEHTAAVADLSNILPGFEAYPNPAKDRLQIRTEEDGLLTLLDLSGKVITRTQIRAGMKAGEMDISGLAAGMYVLNVQTASGSRSVRIAKQ
jgi:hypothetical protein